MATGVAESIAMLTCLTCLKLENCLWDAAKGRDEFWVPFSAKVSALVNLKVLCLSDNSSIAKANVGEIAQALVQLPKLSELALDRCKLNTEGMKSLAEHLPGMRALTLLDLTDNRIGPEGAKALAQSLSSMPCFHTLRLTYSCIGVLLQDLT